MCVHTSVCAICVCVYLVQYLGVLTHLNLFLPLITEELGSVSALMASNLEQLLCLFLPWSLLLTLFAPYLKNYSVIP